MTEPGQPVSEPADPWQSVPSGATPPPPAPGAPGYGYPPPYYYPGYQVRRTNGLAIAALVCGICGFLYFIPAILGVVFGIIGVRQTKRDGTDGRGMAIAGIVTGSVWLALLLVIIIAFAASSN
ncbi:MAG TPA: DUF4190 domain-containing protein [Actinospica sp.]|nr:DUF4190 domain-containing protein [Actinospica sp.]